MKGEREDEELLLLAGVISTKCQQMHILPQLFGMSL